MTESPSRIHFFSWATRISLELPVGFEEALEDTEERYAIYADDLDDDDPPGGRVQTRVTRVGNDDSGNLLRAADAAIAQLGHQPLLRREFDIDHLPALEQTFRYYFDSMETDVVRHEAYVQAGDLIFTIVGLAGADRETEYLPAFREAAATARIILL